MAINDFVAAQKARGTPEEEGEFSVSLDGMSSRYATFQKENRAYYLLRLIQSLVRAGASAVHIKSTRRTLEICVPEFSSGPDWLSPDVLLELLQEPQRWNRGFEGVAAAFLCMRDGVFQALQWDHGNRRLAGSPETGRYEIADASESSDQLYFKVTKAFKLLSSATAVEHMECLSRMASTRTPITFDGRLLTAVTPAKKKPEQGPVKPAEQKVAWFREYTREYLLIEAETAEPPGQGWAPLNERCGKWETANGWAPLKLFLPGAHEPYAHLAISPHLEGKTRIWPILDGVVASRPIESFRFPALEGYIDAPDYKTDLSGLSVLDGKPLIEEAGKFYRSILLHLREFGHLLEASWDLSYPEYPLSLITTAITGISCMGGLPYPMVTIPPALIIDVVASRVRFDRNRQDFTERFREELLQRVDGLLKGHPEDPGNPSCQ